ncbi:MAG: molecular chaperone DnaK [Myxococcales bacterium]|nr:MAG: molecular chaperone DnaK [Myxococcales bacterium]
MARVIGIDLGTTNSCAAYIEEGVPSVIPNKAGYKITPSVVAITASGKRLIGHAAKRQAITNPTNTVFSVKRLIGRTFDSQIVQAARISSPYELEEGPNADVRIRMHGKLYSIPEISAMILAEMKKVAETHLGESVEKAVITVPAYFKDPQRQATKDAGMIAGLDVLRILNEPTAAALAYGYGKSMRKKVAVYDLGGGTFDISIMEISDGVYEVITSNGDTFLGGEDFDSRIMEWLLDEFFQEHGADLREDKMAMQRLKDAAESAKISLSTVTETEINLPFVAADAAGQPLHLQKRLTREELEEMVADLVERTVDICQKAVRDAQLRVDDVDNVLLVGGQTRMPMVQRSVAEFFQTKPLKNLNPDEAVALGAAIQGNMLLESKSDSLLLDLTPHALGVGITGGYFKEIISKDSPIPISKSHVFTTETDFQEAVRIIVLQGEGANSESNILLGEFVLNNIKRSPRGETRIKVFFDLDGDGTLKVSARDMDTGQQQSIMVSAYSYLTEKEISDMVEDNREYVLEQQYEETLERVRSSVSVLISSIESAVPRLRAQLGGSAENERALQKILDIVESGKAAIEANDMERLMEVEGYLKRTHSILQQNAASS